jgi:hypothetical protein
MAIIDETSCWIESEIFEASGDFGPAAVAYLVSKGRVIKFYSSLKKLSDVSAFRKVVRSVMWCLELELDAKRG